MILRRGVSEGRRGEEEDKINIITKRRDAVPTEWYRLAISVDYAQGSLGRKEGGRERGTLAEGGRCTVAEPDRDTGLECSGLEYSILKQ